MTTFFSCLDLERFTADINWSLIRLKTCRILYTSNKRPSTYHCSWFKETIKLLRLTTWCNQETVARSYIWTAKKDIKTWLIIAVMYTTWAVLKVKSEKHFGLNGIRTHDCDTGSVLYQLSCSLLYQLSCSLLYQLSYQAKWELVTLWVHGKLGRRTHMQMKRSVFCFLFYLLFSVLIAVLPCVHPPSSLKKIRQRGSRPCQTVPLFK